MFIHVYSKRRLNSQLVVRKAAQSLEAALGLLASSGARVVRRKSRAVLVHMRVRRLCAHFREREGVPIHPLTSEPSRGSRAQRKRQSNNGLRRKAGPMN